MRYEHSFIEVFDDISTGYVELSIELHGLMPGLANKYNCCEMAVSGACLYNASDIRYHISSSFYEIVTK